MATVKQMEMYINSFAPFDTQEDFDNAGFLVGDGERNVTRALIALDATKEVIQQAIELKAELIITHHPIIFHPLKKLMADSPVYLLAQHGISVISAHTNLDKAKGGVNDVLAEKLGLQQVSLLEGGEEMGRIGELSHPMEPDSFAQYVKQALDANGLRYTVGNRPVQKVAVLGGGGDFALYPAMEAGADALVTGEAKHHILLDAHSSGFTFVDAGHFDTENLVCPALKQRLEQEFPQTEFILADFQNPVLYLGD